jgi:hypothetical protein
MTATFHTSSAGDEYAVRYVFTAFYPLTFRNLGFYIGLFPLLSDNEQRVTRLLGSIYIHDVQNFDTVEWPRFELRTGLDDGMRNLAPTAYVRPATRNMVVGKKRL